MEKTKINALILDYGGVISKPQNPDCISRMCQVLGQDIDDFMDVYRSTRAGYDNGRLSAEAYWRTVVQRMGREPNDDVIKVLIQQDVEGWTEVNQAMLAFIAQSREKLHKLAIISNMTREALAFITEHSQWLTYFDACVFSFEVGVNKPDSRIYEICLDRLTIPAQACLFVDDSEENVLGARRTGMHGIHYTSFPRFLQELEENYELSNGLALDTGEYK